jgi:hypothetical protein
MRVGTLIVVLVVWLTASLIGVHGMCSEGNADKSSNMVESILAESPDVDAFDDDLVSNTTMRKIVNQPKRYVADVDAYLRKFPKAGDTRVRIAVYSLQCLPLDDYLRFVDRLSEASFGAVSSWALLYSVVPDIDWSTRLAVQFRDPRIRETLSRAARSPNATPSLKRAITAVLSGSVARHIVEQKMTPILRCSEKQ